MTCVYPDRVNAVIALDGAPVKQADGKYHPYYNFFYNIVKFMLVLYKIQERKGLTRKAAQKMIKEEFSDDRAVAAMLLRLMDQKSKELSWKRNI